MYLKVVLIFIPLFCALSIWLRISLHFCTGQKLQNRTISCWRSSSSRKDQVRLSHCPRTVVMSDDVVRGRGGRRGGLRGRGWRRGGRGRGRGGLRGRGGRGGRGEIDGGDINGGAASVERATNEGALGESNAVEERRYRGESGKERGKGKERSRGKQRGKGKAGSADGRVVMWKDVTPIDGMQLLLADDVDGGGERGRDGDAS